MSTTEFDNETQLHLKGLDDVLSAKHGDTIAYFEELSRQLDALEQERRRAIRKGYPESYVAGLDVALAWRQHTYDFIKETFGS